MAVHSDAHGVSLYAPQVQSARPHYSMSCSKSCAAFVLRGVWRQVETGGMSALPESAAARILPNLHVSGWRGPVFRSHGPIYAGDDARGSIRSSGRYHVGHDMPPELRHRPPWPALYTSLDLGVCTWERIRHLDADPQLALTTLRGLVISQLDIQLNRVVDLRDPSAVHLAYDDLCGPDCALPRSLAAAALDLGIEGLLTPSATGLGLNLVILVTNLDPASTISVIGTVAPRLDRD